MRQCRGILFFAAARWLLDGVVMTTTTSASHCLSSSSSLWVSGSVLQPTNNHQSLRGREGGGLVGTSSWPSALLFHRSLKKGEKQKPKAPKKSRNKKDRIKRWFEKHIGPMPMTTTKTTPTTTTTTTKTTINNNEKCLNEAVCGPRPLGPNYLCSDGETMAGPGGCVWNSDRNACAWDVVDCPDVHVQEPKCYEDDCGPQIGAPNQLCPDGVTTAGPGGCVWKDDQNRCGWEFIQCPMCKEDKDCGSDQFCSKGECRRDGTCQDLMDCLNPSNEYSMKNNCELGRYLECNDMGRCDYQCTKQSMMCPPGKDEVNCLVEPCTVSDCDASDSCVNYYCGGCHAIHFDAAGNQVCLDAAIQVKPQCNDADCAYNLRMMNYLCPDGVTMAGPGDCTYDFDKNACTREVIQCPTCKEDQDCGRDQFCSKGECRVDGTCQDLADCLNPANEYAVDDYDGYLTCDARKCSIQPSTSTCPPGANEGDCSSSACAVTRCGIPSVSCIDYSCGGCSAIFFDSKGNQVCGPELPSPNPVALASTLPCTSDDSCGKGQYCAGGECRKYGTCGVLVDCYNPANEYKPDCEGARECNGNVCEVTKCTGSPCPKGVPQVRCFAQPCAVTDCEESNSCADYYCGGCVAINFDAAGNEVCGPALQL